MAIFNSYWYVSLLDGIRNYQGWFYHVTLVPLSAVVIPSSKWKKTLRWGNLSLGTSRKRK